MSKYQELCERFGKTKNAFNKSKAIFEQTFKQKLSDYLECEADLILLKSSEPQLGEELQHGWEWEYDFNLEITLKTTKYADSFEFFDFSCFISSQAEGKYDFDVKYKGNEYSLDEEIGDINDLFDIMFEELKILFFLYK